MLGSLPLGVGNVQAAPISPQVGPAAQAELLPQGPEDGTRHFIAETTDAPPAVEPVPARAVVSVQELVLIGLAVIGVWLFFSRGWHRLDRPPPSVPAAPRLPQAFSVPVGAALFVSALLMGSVAIVIAREALGIDTEQAPELRDLALIMLARYGAEAIVIAIFAVLVYRARSRPDRRPSTAKAVLLGIGAWILFWLFVLSLSWLVNLLLHLVLGWTPDPVAHATLALLMKADRTIWLFVAVGMVTIVAPIFEEVIYRGIVQETLARLEMPPWYAIALTSVMFAVMHMAAAPSRQALPGMLAALFVLSLGFGWAYAKTGRLAAPIAMHILFNAGNLLMATWTT